METEQKGSKATCVRIDITNESGWLIGGDTSQTFEITEDDMEKLLELAAGDDVWMRNVQAEVQDYDRHQSRTYRRERYCRIFGRYPD